MSDRKQILMEMIDFLPNNLREKINYTEIGLSDEYILEIVKMFAKGTSSEQLIKKIDLDIGYMKLKESFRL